MSGIFGVWNLDGRPVERELLERMSAALDHRGPDGSGIWMDGAVGLGHRMLHTTPESLHETQPLKDETGRLVLTMDGRVDNREELRSALLQRGAVLRDDTDAELVLKSYEAWGEDCPERIIGDFAFAIWDAHLHQLFCARDFMGLRPLYFHVGPGAFLFGSELCAVLEDPRVSTEPNVGMIAEYLTTIASQEETLYRAIRTLPPHHAMMITERGERRIRYWDPANALSGENPRLRGNESGERFREVFREAVRCRLRSHRPVAFQLSGGLDSSSVVAMAAQLARDSNDGAGSLDVFPVVVPGPRSDERRYVDEVVRHFGLRSYPACGVEPPGSIYEKRVERYRDFPGYPNGDMMNASLGIIRESGSRVVLSGQGGDQLFSVPLRFCSGHLLEFKIGRWIREARKEAGASEGRSLLRLCIRHGLGDLVPAFVRETIDRLRSRDFSWIAPAFSGRVALNERLNKRGPCSCHPFEGGGTFVTDGWEHHSLLHIERHFAEFQLEGRHPFYDRRLVECVGCLPHFEKRQAGLTKCALRKALAPLLPGLVRDRLDKADFMTVMAAALCRNAGMSLFSSLSLFDRGILDRDRVVAMYADMEHKYLSGKADAIRNIWPLSVIYGLELWTRSLARSANRTSNWHEACCIEYSHPN